MAWLWFKLKAHSGLELFLASSCSVLLGSLPELHYAPQLSHARTSQPKYAESLGVGASVSPYSNDDKWKTS